MELERLYMHAIDLVLTANTPYRNNPQSRIQVADFIPNRIVPV